MTDTPLLDTIRSPADLADVPPRRLHELAEEIRSHIIATVSRRGGHLASNLGVTELTIALHSVFDFRTDRLCWDVGHQCYPHKLLTGRKERFETLRQADGISGFPAPSESPYDPFATGHAGSAISTAVGLALAEQAAGRDNKVVAVVGDASIVNGLSFEGLNNAGTLDRQLLIILNDNSMAIDRTRGALAAALDRIRSTHTYADLKASTRSLLRHLPGGEGIAEAIHHLKEGMRTALHGEKFFEPLGLTYFGPVDGHNIRDLSWILRRLGRIDKPCILHVHTEKGRGCEYAVEDPCRFHSPSAWTMEDGKAVFPDRKRASWTHAFADCLADLADADPRIVALTAAMPDGTGLARFRTRHPDRCLDVGISESHAVACAAGLAKGGRKPVVAIYSTFLQRAFDQVFHEACLQGLGVVFCMDRAGLVGSDGAVHHGIYDISYLRPLPGMVLAAPADAVELRALLQFALASGSPVAIRYPRDDIPADLPGPCPGFQLGRSRLLRQGADGTILCYGTTCQPALAAARILQRERDLDLAVVNARFAKPLDTEAICQALQSGPVLTVEDHAAIGGFGSAVLELAAANRLDTSAVDVLGVGDAFVPHAARQQQLVDQQICPGGIADRMARLIQDAAGRQSSRKQGS